MPNSLSQDFNYLIEAIPSTPRNLTISASEQILVCPDSVESDESTLAPKSDDNIQPPASVAPSTTTAIPKPDYFSVFAPRRRGLMTISKPSPVQPEKSEESSSDRSLQPDVVASPPEPEPSYISSSSQNPNSVILPDQTSDKATNDEPTLAQKSDDNIQPPASVALFTTTAIPKPDHFS